MKNALLYKETPCNLIEVFQRFKESSRLHLIVRILLPEHMGLHLGK